MKLIYLLVFLLLTGCASRPEIKDRSQALRLVEKKPVLQDDLPLAPLLEGIRQNLENLRKRGPGNLTFGERKLSRSDYIEFFESFLGRIKGKDKKEVLSEIESSFDFHEIYGKEKWGDVFMTSYFTPLIPGSKRKTKKFSQPLYAVPEDLVTVDVSAFMERFPKLKDSLPERDEQKSKGFVLRGRIDERENGKYIVPFYDRGEIDVENLPLNTSTKILAWVDPIESFFLQIQGSGYVKFKNGEKLLVGYAAQNGHSYVAIGRHLKEVIDIERMSLQTIDAYLRTLPREKMQEILNFNPSYVFFRKLDRKPITSNGTEVVDGRTIATDRRYFPKNAIAYLEFEKPIFDDNEEVKSWEKSGRIVIDQDTGGAIRGPHRLDLYWGEGPEARRHAGVMKNWGKLYYLAPKEELLGPGRRLP